MKDFNKRLIETIRMEKENHIRSGVYGLTQREFAYNSNKIEGSRLTKEHTASLFDTGSIYMEGVFRGKDVEEASGHFAMFNEMLNSLEKPLSETVIKEFHRYLKQGVFEDIANGYAIGEYKKRKNYVGNIETAAPEEVADKIKALLNWYHSLDRVTIDDLAKFHLEYERIHPFQDGNGRTGRMILFRECLKNDICPFLVRDENKAEYVNALSLCDINKLSNYFKKEQQWYYDKIKDSLI